MLIIGKAKSIGNIVVDNVRSPRPDVRARATSGAAEAALQRARTMVVAKNLGVFSGQDHSRQQRAQTKSTRPLIQSVRLLFHLCPHAQRRQSTATQTGIGGRVVASSVYQVWCQTPPRASSHAQAKAPGRRSCGTRQSGESACESTCIEGCEVRKDAIASIQTQGTEVGGHCA